MTPFFWTWDGHAMLPLDRFSRLAESSFTAGHAYKMIVARERDAQRTTEQNARLWAMLNEVAEQKKHYGRQYSPDQWKVLFLHAWGEEVHFMPSLDGDTFVPYGFQSSSKLSRAQMNELITFIEAWGTQNGVVFHDPIAGEIR